MTSSQDNRKVTSLVQPFWETYKKICVENSNEHYFQAQIAHNWKACKVGGATENLIIGHACHCQISVSVRHTSKSSTVGPLSKKAMLTLLVEPLGQINFVAI
jgi:hypothetical protein